MPEQKSIKKAVLQQIAWNEDGDVVNEGQEFEVQFNPETLSVAISNQVAGGDQAGGSAIQFNSKGTTKLTFDLIFDVTDPKIDQRFNKSNKPSSRADVRKITKLVADFMQTERTGSGQNTKFTPPGVRFKWGTFRFDGVVDSLTEKIDFFSDQGVPLRSTLSVSITKQDVDINFNAPDADSQGNPNAGTQETASPSEGSSMADQTNQNGGSKPWQGDALANGIENPRNLPTGQPLNMGTDLAASVNAGLQGGAGFGAGLSAGISGGIGGGLGGSLGGSFGGSIGGGLSIGAGIGGGISGGIGGGLGGGIGAGIGGGLDAGISGGFGGDVGAGFDASFSGGFSDGIGVDISADSGFNIDASTELVLSGGIDSDFDVDTNFNF